MKFTKSQINDYIYNHILSVVDEDGLDGDDSIIGQIGMSSLEFTTMCEILEDHINNRIDVEFAKFHTETLDEFCMYIYTLYYYAS